MESSPLISKKHLKQALLFLMAVLICFMGVFWFFSAKNTNQDLTEYETYLENRLAQKFNRVTGSCVKALDTKVS